ncbi:hypothetical protein K3169_10880 [Pseudomonas phytophila]|uniref:Uncharacterized protein n=1 Tax=Pseudomonas phytophila TaxID=2867264 RepID=A0ABY6FKG3_9PSED|nr:hypothetical protein [Pseudomonas phytophila]UXZ98324.1 hypothetical protein K3169_10880 [Pseudomonas phytophila]
MSKHITKSGLPVPFVPAADPVDGLLRVSTLNNPIDVEFRLWEFMYPGYYVQLMLNGELVGAIWTMSDSDTSGDIISMVLDPEHLLNDGIYRLGLRATNNENGVSSDSATTSLIVDRTSPGAALLAPAMFASVSFGDFLNAKIPSHAGMEPGDLIQTVCNGIQGPTYRVQPENLTTSPIEISFTQEFLEGLFSDRVNITYHVTDRAGNRSILAQSVEITMQR